jgi:hypothetical protein
LIGGYKSGRFVVVESNPTDMESRQEVSPSFFAHFFPLQNNKQLNMNKLMPKATNNLLSIHKDPTMPVVASSVTALLVVPDRW